MTVPACRTLTIAAESRTLTIAAESRTLTVPAEGTNDANSGLVLYGVPLYGAIRYGIDSDAPTERTLTIEACKDGG